MYETLTNYCGVIHHLYTILVYVALLGSFVLFWRKRTWQAELQFFGICVPLAWDIVLRIVSKHIIRAWGDPFYIPDTDPPFFFRYISVTLPVIGLACFLIGYFSMALGKANKALELTS